MISGQSWLMQTTPNFNKQPKKLAVYLRLFGVDKDRQFVRKDD